MDIEVVICAYHEVGAWLLERDFTHVVSIGGPGTGAPEALDGPWPRVLRLEFVDTAPYDYDPDGPQEEHVEALLDFCDAALAAGGPALFHCAQGVSRSSASALALIAMVLGSGREEAAVRRLQAVEGGWRARPNTRLVQLADELLAREGALERAVEEVFYAGG